MSEQKQNPKMEKKIIAVIGATGSQGKGVVEALIKEGTFKVRAVTRNAGKYKGNAHEVVKADLTDWMVLHIPQKWYISKILLE